MFYINREGIISARFSMLYVDIARLLSTDSMLTLCEFISHILCVLIYHTVCNLLLCQNALFNFLHMFIIKHNNRDICCLLSHISKYGTHSIFHYQDLCKGCAILWNGYCQINNSKVKKVWSVIICMCAKN